MTQRPRYPLTPHHEVSLRPRLDMHETIHFRRNGDQVTLFDLIQQKTIATISSDDPARIMDILASLFRLALESKANADRAEWYRKQARPGIDQPRNMVSLSRAAEAGGYSRGTLLGLINRGAVYGVKSGNRWMVDLNTITPRHKRRSFIGED